MSGARTVRRSESTPPRAARRPWLASALPYVAVLIGLDALGSGWLAYLLYHCGMVVILVRSGWHRRIRLLARGWHRTAGALLVGGALGVVPLVLISSPTWAEPELLRVQLAGLGLAGASWWGLVVYHTLVNPWLEELYWRGYLLSSARGVAAGDVAFAGYHLLVLRHFLPAVWLVVALVALIAAAWCWRRVAIRRGGLVVPVASHVAGGGGALIAVGLLLR